LILIELADLGGIYEVIGPSCFKLDSCWIHT